MPAGSDDAGLVAGARRVVAASLEEERRCLSPQACAAHLMVTAAFIRAEVKDGRLVARVLTRASGRRIYRIDPADFTRYVERFWPRITFPVEQ